MRRSRTLVWLAFAVALWAVLAAGVGVFWPQTGASFPFTTLRGEVVTLFGRGWYRLDTPLAALGFRAADLVSLFLAVPLLLVATWRYRGGSYRGGLLLAGLLAYFFYNALSVSVGAAYNPMFVVYLALLATSLIALVLAHLVFDLAALPAHFAPDLPHRAIGGLLIVSGLILLGVWLGLSVLPALLAGVAPGEVASYTTFTTGVLDVGLVAPALFAIGLLCLRREALGTLLAATALVFIAMLGPSLLAAGLMQLRAGVMSPGQAAGFSLPFLLLTLTALGLALRLYGKVVVPDAAPGLRASPTDGRPALPGPSRAAPPG